MSRDSFIVVGFCFHGMEIHGKCEMHIDSTKALLLLKIDGSV